MTLQSSMNIASQGMTAQSERLKIFANNVANIDTPNYQRKIPLLVQNNTMSFEDILNQMRNGVIHTGVSFAPNGVEMPGVVADTTPGKKIYSPNHPEADKDGYITSSNVSPLTEIADATTTARVYEANLAVMGIVKQMASRALEIGRGQ
jgi:flagellar basal-body rod protein FlgC